MKTQVIILISLTIFLCSTCKKDKQNTVAYIKGKVMNESTNKEIQGLNVTIEKSCGIGWHTVNSTFSDGNGLFVLSQDLSDGCGYLLNLNSYPNYNNKLSSYWIDLKPGDNIDRIFYLYSFAELIINTSTTQPLTIKDSLWISIPGISCGSMGLNPSCENIYTNRARANKNNLVKWTISRNGNRKTFQDSVYCPLDSAKHYDIIY